MKWINGLMLFLLMGCATQQEIAAQRQYQAQQYQEQLANQCLGFAQGTPEFSQCMMQLHQAKEQHRTAIGAALIGSGALNKPSYTISMPPPLQSPPLQPTIPIRQPINTNCYRDNLGNIRCTTY